MIYATVNMTIGDYSSICDNKIFLYRGDKNVEIRIVMKGNKFTILDSTYAQMIIRRPSTTSIFSKPEPIKNDTVVFVITGDMIDELKEIGEYTFQIRLYDDTMTARATLPPCESTLIIERPIDIEGEGEAAVNLATVNHSTVMLADTTSVEEDIFTEDNEYNRTIWVGGDLITDVRLNKVEDALYFISRTDIEQNELIDTHTHDEYLTEHQDISHLATKAEIPSLDGLATETYVQEQIGNASLGGEVDLSNYVTEQELEQKGYLTEHQDISHLATKAEIPSIEGLATEDYVDEKISQIEPGGGGMTEEEREQLEKNTSDISTILGIVDTPPSYTKPTLSISFNTSTLEHNKATSVTITPNFKQNDAGSVSKYVLYKNETEIFNNTTVSAYTDSATINHNGSISYSATVTYGDGVIKNTLLGIPYPNTSIKAGSVSASGTIRAYALSYYGVINSSTITENDISSLNSRLSSAKSYTYTVSLSEQRIVYMYPQSFGTLTSIKDANNFDYINSYTRSTLSYNGVDYYVYILTDPVTITGFKQIFN